MLRFEAFVSHNLAASPFIASIMGRCLLAVKQLLAKVPIKVQVVIWMAATSLRLTEPQPTAGGTQLQAAVTRCPQGCPLLSQAEQRPSYRVCKGLPSSQPVFLRPLELQDSRTTTLSFSGSLFWRKKTGGIKGITWSGGMTLRKGSWLWKNFLWTYDPGPVEKET